MTPPYSLDAAWELAVIDRGSDWQGAAHRRRGMVATMDGPLSDAVGWLHFLGAIVAIALGLSVLLLTKGTLLHKSLGTIYVLVMIGLNVAALALHRADAFGPFHILAVISLTTVLAGVIWLIASSKRPQDVAVHAYLMSWSYVGLLAAGVGQSTVALRLGAAWVWPAILGTLLVGGILIHGLLPRLLRGMFGTA